MGYTYDYIFDWNEHLMFVRFLAWDSCFFLNFETKYFETNRNFSRNLGYDYFNPKLI